MNVSVGSIEIYGFVGLTLLLPTSNKVTLLTAMAVFGHISPLSLIILPITGTYYFSVKSEWFNVKLHSSYQIPETKIDRKFGSTGVLWISGLR